MEQSSIMDCPVCKDAMITLELKEVEIDHCCSCGGIWLDAGELEMLLGDTEETQALLKTFTVAKDCGEKKRKCPICLKKMEKVLVDPENKSVLIDKCVRLDGLWFDRGELKEIFSAAKFKHKHKVEELLDEIFKSEN